MSRKRKTPFKVKYSPEQRMWVGTHADYKNIGYRDHSSIGALLGIKKMIADESPQNLRELDSAYIVHK